MKGISIKINPTLGSKPSIPRSLGLSASLAVISGSEIVLKIIAINKGIPPMIFDAKKTAINIAKYLHTMNITEYLRKLFSPANADSR
jgi:hypothetical protein